MVTVSVLRIKFGSRHKENKTYENNFVGLFLTLSSF